MKILIVGNGGREHAIAWKVAQDEGVEEVFVAPGNAGTQLEPKVTNVNIEATAIDALLGFAKDNAIDLTIVGPETPLSMGIVDAFQSVGLACFGPTQAATQLESSKDFSKAFMQRHRIPTAAYATFTETNGAVAYILERGAPIVIKADGLAAGKGVVVARSEDEATRAVREMLENRRFGEAGGRIIIEDCLQGEEVSFIVMVDGTHALPLATSQDHKALYDGGKGPNTGGMGAYSPAPLVTPALHDRIMREVIQPTVDGMAAEGHPYVGFLYAGLMIGPDGIPKVLEFNCRLGDPETQPILMRLQSGLPELCLAALNHGLATITPRWDPRAALGVVLASEGYPGDYRKGDRIDGLTAQPSLDCKVFHAGTVQQGQDILTAGGRVLCATALGDGIPAAQQSAYDLARTLHWPGVYYRTDIGLDSQYE